MRSKIKDVLWLAVLAAICYLLVWHVASWHAAGRYEQMFQDAKAGKSMIPTLYNLGLMVALGLAIGLLMECVTRIIGYKIPRRSHFEDNGDELP